MNLPDHFETLRFRVQNQVATLTFHNPASRNALSAQMRVELAQVLAAVRADRDIRALILTGANGHFCAGGDIRAMAANANMDAGSWRNRMQDLHTWLEDLITLDRPVVAAVDGAAAGAGFSFALAADFVLATPRAKFCMSFMKIGLVPDCGAFLTLPRVVGMQRAKELMLSARDVSAEEALRLGIVMELHAPDQLLPRAEALAASFVHASPTAVSLVKRTLAGATGAPLATLLEQEATAQAVAAGAPEHQAAVKRFLAKEPLAFQWPVQG